MGLKSRLRRLEGCIGVESESVEEHEPVTEEQQDRALKRLTDDELEAVEEVAQRFGGLRGVRMKELTDRELKALYRFYKNLIEIVEEEDGEHAPKN